MRLPGSLRARIAVAAVVAVGVCGLLAGVLLVAAVERDGRNQVDADLRERADSILRRPGDAYGRRHTRADTLLRGSDTFAQVAYGDEVTDQAGDVPDQPLAVPEEEGFETIDIAGTPWRSLTLIADDFDGNPRLQIASSLAPVDERVSSIRRLVLVLGLSALALTALAAWGLTTLAVRPLARLRGGAARIRSAEDLSTPLEEDQSAPDEVRQLAGALNDMLARLGASSAQTERALQATRRFAADAGHELRTPLTALRAQLDTLARNPDLPLEQRNALVSDMTAEQDRMVHLLEGLQALARGEAAESLPREPVELGDVLDSAVHAARKRHPGVQYELAGRVDEGTVDGWEGGLRLLVDNLLDNAALHGRTPGGSVAVGLERADGRLVIRVEDDGPGIPPDQRERLLEPFARGEGAAPNGTGLGLAIVAQQAAIHGGELRLSDSGRGGLGVEVVLPASNAVPQLGGQA